VILKLRSVTEQSRPDEIQQVVSSATTHLERISEIIRPQWTADDLGALEVAPDDDRQARRSDGNIIAVRGLCPFCGRSKGG
jgi:hypothetical protein